MGLIWISRNAEREARFINQMSSERHSSRGREDRRGGYREEGDSRAFKSTKLFVTNIDSKHDEDDLKRDLRQEFEKFGQIKEIVVKTRQGSPNSYAFVEFNNVEDAEKAVNALNRTDFKGKELKVEYSKGVQGKRRMFCYVCRRESHIARDCPDNGRDSYRRRRSNSRGSPRRRSSGDSRSRSKHRRHRRSRSRSGRRDRDARDYKDRRDRGYERRRYSPSRSPSVRQDKRRVSRDRSNERK